MNQQIMQAAGKLGNIGVPERPVARQQQLCQAFGIVVLLFDLLNNGTTDNTQSMQAPRKSRNTTVPERSVAVSKGYAKVLAVLYHSSTSNNDTKDST